MRFQKSMLSNSLGLIKIPLSAILIFLIFSLIYVTQVPTETGKIAEIEKKEISTTSTSIKPKTTTSPQILTTQKTTSTIHKETTTLETTTSIEKIENATDPCEILGCPPGTKFVGSKKSNKYHPCDSKWAKRIEPKNLICFMSEEEAQVKGYEASKPSRLKSTTVKKEITVTTTQEKDPCISLGCPAGTQFVGSKESNKYHSCDCPHAKRIKQENLICFSSVEEAESMGYEPCKLRRTK